MFKKPKWPYVKQHIAHKHIAHISEVSSGCKWDSSVSLNREAEGWQREWACNLESRKKSEATEVLFTKWRPNLAALIQRNLDLWEVKCQDTFSNLNTVFIFSTYSLFLSLISSFFCSFSISPPTHTLTYTREHFSCTGQMGALQRQVCIGVSSQHVELLFSRPLAYAACSHHYCLYTLSNHNTLW